MSTPLMPQAPTFERPYAMAKRKLHRLLTQEDNISQRALLATTESNDRATLAAVWWDQFLRFAIPYIAAAIHDCHVYESSTRDSMMVAERRQRGKLDSWIGTSTLLMVDWDEERGDILRLERREWAALLTTHDKRLREAAGSTLRRVFHSYTNRIGTCQALIEKVRSLRPKPQIVIPASFWSSFNGATDELLSREQRTWGYLWSQHKLDCAFWGEMAGRRHIRFLQQRSWIELTGTFTLLQLGMQSLESHVSFLSQSRRAYVSGDLIAATSAIAGWWRRRSERQARRSTFVRRVLEGYRPVINKRIIEYHDQLDHMQAIVSSKPDEATTEEWELVTNLRALERGHELGLSIMWREYVAVFNRMADNHFCIPKWRQSTMPIGFQSNEPLTITSSIFTDEQAQRGGIEKQFKLSLVGLGHSMLEALNRNNGLWANEIHWLAGTEGHYRISIEKEESVWRGEAASAMSRIEPRQPAPPIDRQGFIDRMLMLESRSSLPPAPPPEPEPSPPESVPSLQPAASRAILLDEAVARSTLSSDYVSTREGCIVAYVWEAILGPNYWIGRDEILREEQEARQILVIGFGYDSTIVHTMTQRSERLALMDDEAFRRKHLATKSFKSTEELLKIEREAKDGIIKSLSKVPQRLLRRPSVDRPHLEANEVLRAQHNVTNKELLIEEREVRDIIILKESTALEGHLRAIQVPLPYRCSVRDMYSVTEAEEQGRRLIWETAMADLAPILASLHESYVQTIAWPLFTRMWLTNLAGPWSEPRLLSDTIVCSLTMFASRMAHIETIEAAQRHVLEELQNLEYPTM